MNKLGFTLKRLRVEKSQKDFAEVSFQKGLNVISGASDTGKTYIYECINYLLGGKDDPKEIPEAGGYKWFYLECETRSGETFTIERILGEKDVTITKGDIDEAHKPTSEGRELMGTSKTQSKTSNESLPNYLLKMSGFSENALISKNVRNEKKELSFRDVAPLIMVDEERVISKSAPFLTDQVVNQTKERGVFKYVVSGSDDSELEEVEDPEIRRNKLKAQLEYIEELLKGLNVKISKLEEEKFNIPEDTKGYDFLFGDVSKIEQEIETLSSQRATSIREKENLSLELVVKRQLMQRFLLLKEHYTSDLERLEFITDGGNNLRAIENKNCECVLCGQKLSRARGDISEEFVEALEAEKTKTVLSSKDLTTSIQDLEESISGIQGEIENQVQATESISNKIEKELLPMKDSLSAKLQILIKSEKKQSKLKELRNQIQERTNERDSIQIDLRFVESGPSKGSLPKKQIKALEEYIREILKRWKFIENEYVSIELESFDTEIDGKKRKLYGKGKRSLIMSANIVSLMLYCMKEDLPHPGFVLIDTPLTPYKDTDSAEDKLADKVQNAFYRDLASIKMDGQIIVIENKEPPEDIADKINHIHFSGNSKIDRKAFIPV